MISGIVKMISGIFTTNNNTIDTIVHTSTDSNHTSHSTSQLGIDSVTNDIRNNILREIFEFIHDHYRYILTRNGLADHHQRPARLSIHAILSARLMNEFKEVLLSQSFREKTWPVVESINQYSDIVPWLLANRCPYIYNDETVKTANVYGIYRSYSHRRDGYIYEGEWLDGYPHGHGTKTYGDGYIYEGEWLNGKNHGHGKFVYPDGGVYQGEWEKDKITGLGTHTYADGAVFEGYRDDGVRKGQGKMTYADGNVYEGMWFENKKHGVGTLTYADGKVLKGNFASNIFLT